MRRSQPYDYPVGTLGSTTRYRFANHDYDYYPNGWTASDGRVFEEGYYDENGQHYSNVVAVGASTMLKCAYCGSHMVYTWKEGALPTCEKCGAQLQADITDQKQPEGADYDGGYGNSYSGTSSGKPWQKIFVGFILAVTIISAIGILFPGKQSRNAEETSRSATGSTKTSVFVREIGRTCYMDGEDWYDSTTRCWFWFNDEEAPAQWQYWYEEISSDYGDYGWMEYDKAEDAWYIEATDGNWVQLPSGYDTSGLWHMEDEFKNPY